MEHNPRGVLAERRREISSHWRISNHCRTPKTQGEVDRSGVVSPARRQSGELNRRVESNQRHVQQLIEFLRDTEPLGVAAARAGRIAAVQWKHPQNAISKGESSLNSCRICARHPMGRSQKLNSRAILEQLGNVEADNSKGTAGKQLSKNSHSGLSLTAQFYNQSGICA